MCYTVVCCKRCAHRKLLSRVDFEFDGAGRAGHMADCVLNEQDVNTGGYRIVNFITVRNFFKRQVKNYSVTSYTVGANLT